MSTRGQSRPLAFESVWLRGRCSQSKNRSKNNKDTRHETRKTRKKLTSPTPAMFTRSHTSTASYPESDKLTKAKHTNADLPTTIAADTAPKTRQIDEGEHTNTDLPTIIAADTAPKTRQIDEGRTHKYGPSNHYRRWIHNTNHTARNVHSQQRHKGSDGIAGRKTPPRRIRVQNMQTFLPTFQLNTQSLNFHS